MDECDDIDNFIEEYFEERGFDEMLADEGYELDSEEFYGFETYREN